MSELQFEVGKTYKIVDWDKFAKVERYRTGGKDTFTVIEVSPLLGHAYDSDNICVASRYELNSGAVILVEDETVPRVYDIHHDGSVTYKSHYVPAEDIRAWVQAVDKMSEIVNDLQISGNGVTARVDWQVGYQKIDCDTAHQLYTDYVAGEWKKPVEKTYQAGQRFNHKDGNKYILAQLEDDVFALVSLKDGNRWTSPAKVKNIFAIRLSELTAAHVQFKEI